MPSKRCGKPILFVLTNPTTTIKFDLFGEKFPKFVKQRNIFPLYEWFRPQFRKCFVLSLANIRSGGEKQNVIQF